MRGLRILRSDTDRRSMRVFGNLLTHYGYELSRCRILQTENACRIEISTPHGDADLDVEANLATEPGSPPLGSPFADLREARKFAGPLPFTFDYERQTHSIIRVEGVRQAWNPRPVSVQVQRNTFLEKEPFVRRSRFWLTLFILRCSLFLEAGYSGTPAMMANELARLEGRRQNRPVKRAFLPCELHRPDRRGGSLCVDEAAAVARVDASVRCCLRGILDAEFYLWSRGMFTTISA